MLGNSLNGVRILDLTRFAPGPFASQMLVELGAEVIKIEQPGRGDPLRQLGPVGGEAVQPLFAMLNRGKRSVTLNLKTAEGKAIAQRLAAGMDVLLEGFRPGVMERLGLGYETLSALNERIVYVSISGYGQTGPDRYRAGHDLNYAALGGFTALTGGAEGPPGMSGVPIADMVAGLWAVIGTLTALWQRTDSGRGQHVDVGMLDSVVSLVALPLAERLARGSAPSWGETLLTGGRAYYNVYETSDGGHMTVAAVEPHFWRAFCEAVGHPEWAEQHGNADQRELVAKVAALFRQRPLAHWVELFAAQDCCCEPVLGLEAVVAHPQLLARGMLKAGYSGSPLVRRPLAADRAPPLGEHTAEVLATLGYGDADCRRLREQNVI